MQTYPIIYKIIPTQYAFYIHSDGTLQTKQVTTPPATQKFNSEKEAREYVENYEQII